MRKWAESDKNIELFHDPYAAAFKMIKGYFKSEMKTLQYRTDITPGKTSDFLSRLTDLTSSVGKGKLSANWFSESFFASSHYGKQDPIIGQVLRDFQKTNLEYSSKELRDRNLMKQVLNSLKKAAGLYSLTDKLGATAAETTLFNLENKLIDAKVRFLNGEKGALKEHDNLFAEMKELVDNSYLKIYEEAINIIEGVKDTTTGEWQYGIPKAIVEKFNSLKRKAEKDIRQGNKYTSVVKKYEQVKNGDRILELSNSDIMRWVKDARGNELSTEMARAITSYTTLMDGLYSTLRNGVNKRIDSIAKRMKFIGDTRTEKQFSDLKKELQGKYMPKYEKGFFPHYVRDFNIDFMDGLMKSFDDMQSAGNNLNLRGADPADIIKTMKLHIDKHTMQREKTPEGDTRHGYSRNFFNVVTSYIGDINRFNHKSFTDSHLLDALTAVETIYKKKGSAKEYATDVTEFVLDMTKAANGDYDLDPNVKAVMRSLLSFEFVSKLGVNPRGAARNLTQRFLDYMHWGPVEVWRLKSYLKDMRIKGQSAENYVESVLQDAGLLFEEASPQVIETQFAKPASVTRLIEYNSDTGKYESHVKSKIERTADVMGTVAAKSSWLHRKAENINRKHTFKLAYAQMHRWLDNPKFKNKLREQGKESDAQQETSIRRIAEDYARNMVLLNHFDYADYAKSKGLRSPVGKFLGQFQHFSFEFYERNADIVRESKNDIKTRNFNIFNDAQGLAKAHRMAWIYFLAPLIAGSYMGVDFGNLVEHDTAQRLEQLKVALTGDEEEIKQAFYGKGPVLATFGGPFISDLIEVGMMMDLIDLDEDSLLTLFSGIERRDPDITSDDTSKKLRILNTFLGRFVERHLPLIAKGGMSIGVAAQQELGIYPTAAARKRQKKLQRIRAAAIPSEIELALQQLEGRT